MKEFAGKVAGITGAANGIGEAFALEAARRGMNLALIDIGHDPAARTQAPGPLNKQTSRNRAGCGMKLAPYRMMRLRKQIIK